MARKKFPELGMKLDAEQATRPHDKIGDDKEEKKGQCNISERSITTIPFFGLEPCGAMQNSPVIVTRAVVRV